MFWGSTILWPVIHFLWITLWSHIHKVNIRLQFTSMLCGQRGKRKKKTVATCPEAYLHHAFAWNSNSHAVTIVTHRYSLHSTVAALVTITGWPLHATLQCYENISAATVIYPLSHLQLGYLSDCLIGSVRSVKMPSLFTDRWHIWKHETLCFPWMCHPSVVLLSQNIIWIWIWLVQTRPTDGLSDWDLGNLEVR